MMAKYKIKCPKCGGRLVIEYTFHDYGAVCENCHLAEYGETLEKTLQLVNDSDGTPVGSHRERGRA